MIDIRRPADLHEVRFNELIKQRHAAVIRAVGSDRRNNEKTLAGSERDRMRNLTVADGCIAAPCHRMKRLENTWHQILAPDHHDAFACYHFFPISEIRSPHLRSVSLSAIGRTMPQSHFCDLGMFLASRAAEQQAA